MVSPISGWGATPWTRARRGSAGRTTQTAKWFPRRRPTKTARRNRAGFSQTIHKVERDRIEWPAFWIPKDWNLDILNFQGCPIESADCDWSHGVDDVWGWRGSKIFAWNNGYKTKVYWRSTNRPILKWLFRNQRLWNKSLLIVLSLW